MFRLETDIYESARNVGSRLYIDKPICSCLQWLLEWTKRALGENRQLFPYSFHGVISTRLESNGNGRYVTAVNCRHRRKAWGEGSPTKLIAISHRNRASEWKPTGYIVLFSLAFYLPKDEQHSPNTRCTNNTSFVELKLFRFMNEQKLGVQCKQMV